MKTYKILFWVTLSLLILSLAGFWYVSSIGVGADSLPTNKSTKIQLVDSAGKAINAVVPLELSIKAKNMNCEETNAVFRSLRRKNSNSKSTVCKSDTAIFNRKVFTDSNGSIIISEQLLVQVDKENIKKNVEDYFENKYSAPLTDEESQKLDTIISSAVDNNTDQNKIKSALTTFTKEYLTRNNLYQENAKFQVGRNTTGNSQNNIQELLDNDCVLKMQSFINIAVINAQKNNDFLKLSGQKVIDSVTVKVAGDFLASDTINLSFSNSDYKQNINIVVTDKDTAVEMAKMDAFLKEYATKNNLSSEQLINYRNVLSEYLKFKTIKSLDELFSEGDKNYINKNEQEKNQIRGNFSIPIIGNIIRAIF